MTTLDEVKPGCSRAGPGSGEPGEGTEHAAIRDFSSQEIVGNKLPFLGLSQKMTPRLNPLCTR